MTTGPYYRDERVTIHHANALALPLEDASVDLVVTSPPYFGLRSYQDGGEHYSGQIGAELLDERFATADVLRRERAARARPYDPTLARAHDAAGARS